MQKGWFDVAEVCCSGHVINPAVTSYPEISARFCSICGAPGIRDCPSCGAPIPGAYVVRGKVRPSTFAAPVYCRQCGAEYPWTTQWIEAVCALADEMQSLSRVEREMLKRSLINLTRDATRDAFRQILTDVLTRR